MALSSVYTAPGPISMSGFLQLCLVFKVGEWSTALPPVTKICPCSGMRVHCVSSQNTESPLSPSKNTPYHLCPKLHPKGQEERGEARA